MSFPLHESTSDFTGSSLLTVKNFTPFSLNFSTKLQDVHMCTTYSILLSLFEKRRIQTVENGTETSFRFVQFRLELVLRRLYTVQSTTSYRANPTPFRANYAYSASRILNLSQF